MSEVNKIAKQIIICFEHNHKILICGNGGSAAQANHFAAELVNRMEKWRLPLPAISLSANTSIITAIANDSKFKYIFSRQIEALGKKGDILITLSTSGKSKNILEAIKITHYLGLKVISFPTNKELKSKTPQTQETHLHMIHEISREIEDYYMQDYTKLGGRD